MKWVKYALVIIGAILVIWGIILVATDPGSTWGVSQGVTQYAKGIYVIAIGALFEPCMGFRNMKTYSNS